MKSFLSHKAYRVALISISLVFNQTPIYTVRDHRCGFSASCLFTPLLLVLIVLSIEGWPG